MLYKKIVFHCVEKPHYPFINWMNLSLAIMHTVSTNTHVHDFEWTCVFISLQHIPRSENVGSRVDFVFKPWQSTRLFSKAAVSFHIFTSNVWEFWFLKNNCHCFSLTFFLLLGILVGIKWHLIVIVICLEACLCICHLCIFAEMSI